MTTATPRVLFVGAALSEIRETRAVNEDLEARLRRAGWRTVAASSRRNPVARALHLVARVWTHRREYDVAYVDVYSGRAFLWAAAAGWLLRRLGKPYVLALRGGGLPETARRRPGSVRRLFQGAAAVVAPSGYLRDRMASAGVRAEVIPNPLYLERYPFRAPDRPRPRLVWLRSFHDIYNPVLAVDVVGRLVGRHGDVRLDMVGPVADAEVRRAVTERAVALGIEDRVRVGSGVTKEGVPSRMARGDIFLNTSDVDNTPVTVLEAMACGLCVVSTDVGGIPYLLEDGETALLVPPDAPEAMARAVDRLLTEPGLAARLSRQGRAMVERMGWDTLQPRWESVFIEAWASGRDASGRS